MYVYADNFGSRSLCKMSSGLCFFFHSPSLAHSLPFWLSSIKIYFDSVFCFSFLSYGAGIGCYSPSFALPGQVLVKSLYLAALQEIAVALGGLESSVTFRKVRVRTHFEIV